MVAQIVADRFASISPADAKTLKPFAHLFLDHLHGIVSSANDPAGDGSESYPPQILNRLCCTMAALAEQDRGAYSLLMITIQKQLIARVGLAGLAENAHESGMHFQRRHGTNHIKQLMAVFLAGHLLRGDAVELADRKSLISWMLRLVSTAASEETLCHVLSLVRRGVVASSTEKYILDSSDFSEEYDIWKSHLAHVLRKKGFVWKSRDEIAGEQASGLVVICEEGSELAMNVSTLVDKMRFSIVGATLKESVLEQEYIVKIGLMREMFNSFIAMIPTTEQESIIKSGFIVQREFEEILNGSDVDSGSEPKLATMNQFIWSMICALDLAVTSVNTFAAMMTADKNNGKRRQQLWTRLHTCFQLHSQLERALVIQNGLLKAAIDNSERELDMLENDSIAIQTRIATRMAKGFIKCDASHGSWACASLVGLDLAVVCFVFESQWKRTPGLELSLKHQHELLLVLNRHLCATSELSSYQSVSNSPGCSLSSVDTIKILLSTSDGRRTLKYLSFRAAELGRWINSNAQEAEATAESNESGGDGDTDVGQAKDAGSDMMHELVASSLLCVYQLFAYLLDASHSYSVEIEHSRELLELLAEGTMAFNVPASHKNDKHICQEIFYRFLIEQSIAMRVRFHFWTVP